MFDKRNRIVPPDFEETALGRIDDQVESVALVDALLVALVVDANPADLGVAVALEDAHDGAARHVDEYDAREAVRGGGQIVRRRNDDRVAHAAMVAEAVARREHRRRLDLDLGVDVLLLLLRAVAARKLLRSRGSGGGGGTCRAALAAAKAEHPALGSLHESAGDLAGHGLDLLEGRRCRLDGVVEGDEGRLAARDIAVEHGRYGLELLVGAADDRGREELIEAVLARQAGAHEVAQRLLALQLPLLVVQAERRDRVYHVVAVGDLLGGGG